MVYMIYQQLKTEVTNAYRGRDNLDGLLAEAATYREWLESLEIDEGMKGSLVEPIVAIEEALGLACVRPGR